MVTVSCFYSVFVDIRASAAITYANKPVAHYSQTTMKRRWNNKTSVKHKQCVEHVRSILANSFFLCILHNISPNRVVFGSTQRRFFAVLKDKIGKINFAINCWQRQIICNSVFSVIARLDFFCETQFLSLFAKSDK